MAKTTKKKRAPRTPTTQIPRYAHTKETDALLHDIGQEVADALLRTDTPDDALVTATVEAGTAPAIAALFPPDLTRCQCEWIVTEADVVFGPRRMVRCEERPTVLAFQKRIAEDDEPTGVVALCDPHRVMVEHMYPSQCVFRRVTAEGKIGELC